MPSFPPIGLACENTLAGGNDGLFLVGGEILKTRHGNLFGEFCRYVSLQIMGMIGLSCYILADTFFIAQRLGRVGLAALNIVIPAFTVMNAVAMMLGMGGGARYMLRMSCGEERKGSEVFMHCLRTVGVLSAVLVVLGVGCPAFVARLLGADAETLSMTTTYLRMIWLFSPFFMLNNVLQGFLRNDGAPHLSMAAMLTGSFANILLDWVFLYPLDMGIFGAVLATCSAPVISIGVMSVHFLRRKNRFHLCRTKFEIREAVRICTVGGSAFITEISNGVVIFVFNMLLQEQAGNTGVAAYGVIANLAIVLIAIFNGTAQGMQPLVSRSAAEEDSAASGTLLRYGVITVLGLFAVLFTCICIWTAPVTAIFNSEHDPHLQTLAEQGMRLYFSGMVFAGINILAATYLACTERIFASNLLSLLRGLLVIVPMAILLGKCAGLTGIWLAFPLTEASCFVGTLISLKRQRSGENHAS